MNLSNIFSIKLIGKYRVQIKLLGIKISFNFGDMNIYGKNNIVEVDKNIKRTVIMDGNNNKVIVKSCSPPPRVMFYVKKYFKKRYDSSIKINIKGNNNSVIIEEILNSTLEIDIGNYTGVNNVCIKIGKQFQSVGLAILAYQSNVPVIIGSNCLFSHHVTIRSGELPHRIFDKDTMENLDNSDGILIGNHVWVGEGVYIMKRVKISDNSIVGSASVVTKKFNEENVVIAGNPAKICRRNIMWEKY